LKIFTLGTADRQHFQFTKILNKCGVQVVFDVRRSPSSPQSPQFNRDSLRLLCASQNADYIYLGPELGAGDGFEPRPHGDGTRPPADPLVRDWLASPEFQRCVGIIAGKADKRVTCILCSERLPGDCQRIFLSQALARKGFEIAHILDETTLWTPPAAPAGRRSRPAHRSRRHNHRPQ
jgi:uncharacterized protein (DUF488 family)